jgi:hypothetical protein
MTEESQPVPDYVYVVRARFGCPEREAAWHRWYDEVHIPQILSVPGFHSVRRYRQIDRPEWFAAEYGIDSPAVFEQPRYAEVRGWGEWADCIAEWSRELLQRASFSPAKEARS